MSIDQITSPIELLQALVRIPSVNPEGDPGTKAENVGEGKCARFVGDFLQNRCGAEVVYDEVLPDRPNVIGHMRGTNDPVKSLLFAPHTDTVSVKHMTIEPFGGELKDGKILGRGASDTKGTMAAMLWALYELKDEIHEMDIRVSFVGLMGEEAGQPGSIHFAKKYRGQFDFAVVGEPTELQTVFTHKGCCWIDLITSGKPAHGSTPERGDNAVEAMMEVLRELLPLLRESLAGFNDELLGSPTVNLGKLNGGHSTNIVPHLCRASLDIRETPALREAGGAVALVKNLLDKIGADQNVSLEVAVDSVPLSTDRDHDGVAALRSIGSELTTAPWFCDAGRLAEGDIPAVAVGPGNIREAHTKDEYLLAEDLLNGVDFYRDFIRAYAERC